MFKIRAEKDFYAGLIYVILAAGFLWFGRDYRMGAASRMGPGYFPITLSWILLGFGVVSILRAFVSSGAPLGGLAWKKLGLITLAVLAFGFTITRLGIVFALPFLVIISSMASKDAVYDRKGLLVLIALVVFCVLVFVKGLGIPMPILGSVFDGHVPPSWQR